MPFADALVGNRFSIRIVLLLMGLVLASCSTVGEQPGRGGWGGSYGGAEPPGKMPPGDDEFVVTDRMVDLLKGSAAVILIDENGQLNFVDRDGTLFEPCTREPGPRQCKAFTRDGQVLDIESIPLLYFEGSRGVVTRCPNGELCQICWDEVKDKPVRCK